MVKNKPCRICRFFKKYPYKISEQEFLLKAIREGKSLRNLELLLASYGIKAKKDLINRHIKECLGIEIQSQRKAEKIQKKGILGKLGHIFNKPSPIMKPSCQHIRTESFWDSSSESVRCKCLDCKMLLSGSRDPNSDSRIRKGYRKYRNEVVLEALQR